MDSDITIVGAGPYGLSLGAHLRGRGISFRIFGVPMDFWRYSMPEGMSLKSDGHASSLYDPSDSFLLRRYCADNGLPYADFGLPVTLQTFTSYGLAFQQRLVPEVEEEKVACVNPSAEGFSVSLENGETFTSRNVVLAIGIGYFSYIPTVLRDLSDAAISHSSRFSDLSPFSGRDVAVIGAGASALDLAALLNEVGARPVLITRGSTVEFHQRQSSPRSMRSRLLAPNSGVGPGWHSWLYCNAPWLFHHLPERQRLARTKSHLGPAGGWFIKDAVLGKVPILYNSSVERVTLEDSRVHLQLSSNDPAPQSLSVDQVIAATGYRVDVDRISFLDRSLRDRIDTVQNTPILSSSFESSVPGLYFVGAAAANSFGPVQRFAVGAKFAARRVARSLTARP